MNVFALFKFDGQSDSGTDKATVTFHSEYNTTSQIPRLQAEFHACPESNSRKTIICDSIFPAMFLHQNLYSLSDVTVRFWECLRV